MLVNPDEMDAAARIWLFQSSTLITEDIQVELKEELTRFVNEWAAHKVQLHASGDLLHDRFIRILADERFTPASGCSMDTLHQFIHYLEKKYKLSLMDRMQVAYFNDSEKSIQTVHLHELGQLAKDNDITEETYVFDNLVPNKGEFDKRWKVKIKDSWHKKFLNY